jgi:hypothetical protein
MVKPALFLTRTLLATAVVLALGSTSVDAQKLYRWVDRDGKVHYSDSVPPEAVEQERETLNKQGMTVDRVERAMTPEERAEREAELAELDRERQAKDERDKQDAILLGAYASEADLDRSFKERFDLVEQSLESARIGIRSQQKSLADMLAHAAELERNGKATGPQIATSVMGARKQVGQQREFLHKREAERTALQQEFETTKARYRALKNPASGG